MSDADRALDDLVKTQHALAEQAWDVVRVQDSVKDADAHLSKCRTNLSDAHVKHSKLQRDVNTCMETWRLAVVAEHKPEVTPADGGSDAKA